MARGQRAGTGLPVGVRWGIMGPLLTASHICKRFGVTRALDDVSVEFLPGEVHALMGENGAGKSTLGKTIAGLHRQDSGIVSIRDESGAMRELPPGSLDAAFRAGVRIVHQELAQCPNLSVAENLCLHDIPRTRLGLVDRRAMGARARELLRALEPGIDIDAPLGSLPPGRRQVVQIAGALDESRSAGGTRVVILDEPTSSLSIAEVERLLTIVRALASRGLTIIYVSHRMAEIFQVCDRVTVLRDGRCIATSRVKEIDEGGLIEQMIGRRIEPTARVAPAPRDDRPALRARGLRSPGRIDGVSLDVHPGEVVGLGGLVGSGRSELLDAIFGVDARATGEIEVLGRTVRLGDPRAMINAGVGYVPEDRKLQGLFFDLGIDENLILPAMPSLARAGVRSAARERAAVADRIARFRVKAASPRTPPGSLSGGNQQKLLIARWLTDRTRMLLLDEPTRGIDVGTKSEVHRLVREAAASGVAVLVVSSEMPELLAMSDRVLVMCAGRISGEVSGDTMTQENVLRLATVDSR